MARVYHFCGGCDRRIAEELFSAGRCKGCHESAKLKLKKKVDHYSDDYFTEEEYEEMSNL